ncbi:MAG: response regulator [Fibrobacterales bacterium]
MSSFIIVDDEHDIRTTLELVLQSAGHTVFSVDNAQNAMELGKEAIGESFAIDFLITDIHMPGKRGDILAGEIRLLFPDITVIAITGSIDEEIKSQLADSGCTDIIEKPFTDGQVLALIDRVGNRQLVS